MKKVFFTIVSLFYLLIGLNAQSLRNNFNSAAHSNKGPQQPNEKYKVKWTKNPFDKQLFIQNGGQFDTDTYSRDKIFFQVKLGDIQAYFTASGVIYKYEKYPKRTEEKDDIDKEDRKPEIKYTSYTWENANTDVNIEAQQEQAYYYTYPVGKNGSLKVNVFKRIVYKNIYPGIDIEYSFVAGKAGIKYAIIAHPGADIAKVKLKYSGVSGLQLNANGDAIVQSNMGEITDHAPVSYYGNISDTVSSKYIISSGNEESFSIKTKASTEDLTIDPFSTDPLFAINFDDVFDVDYDYNYNVYAYGSYNPFQLTKFDSNGNQLWTYNATAISANQEYGDFTVDKVTGTSYLVEGWGGWTVGSTADKVNTLGTHVTTYPGPGGDGMNEMWRAEFDECAGKVIIGAGGNNLTSPWKQACILDTGMVIATDVSPLGSPPSNDDVCLEAMDPMGGTVYMATSYSSEGATNQVMSLPVSTLTPPNYHVPDGYSFAEVSEPYFSIYELPSPVYANGINGMAASPNWLYMYDGYTLSQNSRTTGLNNASLSVYPTRIAGLEVWVCWAGLDVDGSDNIYAGFQKSINIYNSSLTLTGNIPLTDTVYDVVLGPNHSAVYAGGIGFVSMIDITPVDNISKTSSPATCGNCNGTATAQLMLSGSPVGSATYQWSTGATTSTISGLCVGTYTVTAYLNGCGSTRFTDTVIINSSAGLPLTITPGGPTTFCSGGSVSLVASGGTIYNWSPATGLSATTGATVTANPTSSQTYTVTDAGGCGSSATVTITVNATPSITASSTSSSICSGNSDNLNAIGATSYTWSPNTDLSATTGSPVTATPTSSITYTVTGTTGGCTSAPQTLAITVNSTPTITTSANPPAICSGNATTLSAGGATNYIWTPNTALSATTGSTVIATPASSITYTVTGSTAGCTSAPQILSITVTPTPTITASATSSTICAGDLTTLNAGGATTYTWSPNINLSATTGSPVSATPTSNITYTVTGTTAGCPSAPVTVAITVNPLPAITITPSGATTFCSGNSVNLTGGGAVTYIWGPSTGLSATTGTTVTANPSSTETYTVTGTDANGCAAAQTTAVTVNTTPTISISASGATTFCSGGSVNLTGNGAVTYTWGPSTGLSATNVAVVNANPLSTETYTVTGTSAAGCTATQTIAVTVNPTPTITIAPLAPIICPGGNVNLTASGATSYTWSPNTNLSATTGTTVNAAPVSTITYSVTGTTGSCSSNQTEVVTVASSLNVSVTPSAPSVCMGDSVTLNAGGAAAYSWRSSAGLSCTNCPNPNAGPTSTVTYTVVGSSGSCADSANVTVTVNPSPTVSVTPPSPTICPGGNVTLTASGALNYTWAPSTSLSATTGSIVTSTPAASQTYTVVGTSGSGCIDTAQVSVTIGPSPIISIAITGISPAVCGGDTIGMVASGAVTYTWAPSAGLNVTTGVYVIASPAITTTYTVTGINAGGCTGTATQVITIIPTPTISISSTTTNICSGDSVQLNAAGANTYTWSPTSSLSASTGSSINAGPSSSTTYTVTGKSAGGCTSKDSLAIIVIPTPTVIVTPASAGICNGDSVVLNASGAASYTWSPSTGISATTGTTVTTIPASSTTYTVTGTSSGCSSNASASITVGSLAVAASATASTICAGTSTTITGTGAVNYTWSPATGLSATTGAVVIANPAVTTTYSLTGSSGAGCSDSTTITINVNITPTVAISPVKASICNGDSVSLTASGATTFTWSPSTGLGSTTGATVTATPAGSTTYTVTGNSGGCSSTDTVSITVGSIVVTATAVSPTFCMGGSSVINATGATNYTWSPSASLSAATGASVTATPSVTTTYNLTGSSGAGCSDSVQVVITVTSAPVVTVSATNDSICSGAATILNASGATNYTWSPSASLDNSTGVTVTATPSINTTYTVYGTIAGGCSDSATVSITVNTASVVTITSSGSDSICNGQNITLTATGTAGNYLWSNGGTTSSITVSPASSTVYGVTESSGTCKDSAKQSVYLYPQFKVTMSADSSCIGMNAWVNAIPTGGKPGYTYAWNNGLGTNAGPLTVVPTGPDPYYSCTIKDGCGDVITDSVMLYTYPTPKASFVPIPADTVEAGQFITFQNNSTGATSYYWALGDGTTSTDSMPLHQYNLPGDFIVTLVASNIGCHDSVSDTVWVTQNIYIPNVFTPNGDGINDQFHVTIGGMKTYGIEIFNRWGEKIFESNSSEIDWDGSSIGGVEESDGTYYYIINATDYKNKSYKYSGYVQLIRN